MLETPEIAHSSATPIAFIHLTIPLADMPQQFGAACQELFAALAAQGITVTGPVTAHHLRRPSSTFDFELAVLVSAAAKPTGRVQAGIKPAMQQARTVYHGGYEGLPAAWGEFHAWTEAQGQAYASDFWETYVVGPASSANPADWRTELARPLLA
jgi:effector-binding domain-containing protein